MKVNGCGERALKRGDAMWLGRKCFLRESDELSGCFFRVLDEIVSEGFGK